MPSVLGVSIEDNLEPKLAFLQTRLRLGGGQVGDEDGENCGRQGGEESEGHGRLRDLVVALPASLGYSVEANLEPTLDFYAKVLGVDDAGLGDLICSQPALLG